MTTRTILLLSSFLFVLVCAGSAQQLPPKPAPEGLTVNKTWTDDDLARLMKQLQPAAATLRKMIDAREAKSAEAHADRIEHIFRDVEDFFDARDLADAETLARDASNHANHVEDAAEANAFDKAAEHFKLLMATCQSCHDRFREQDANGGYRLKKP
jgi:cytochrome c556